VTFTPRQLWLRTRILNKRAHHKIPSPLAGEGVGALGAPTGEGAATKTRERQLRQSMTDAERKLWYALRDRRFAGLKFRRQVMLGRYIVDFVSFGDKLIVEVDGAQHVGSAYDAKRDQWLSAQGFKVLRFWNVDVLSNLEGVLALISNAVINPPSPGPASRARPLPQGERGKFTQ
jgi:very-short-patch-repair endonuclease